MSTIGHAPTIDNCLGFWWSVSYYISHEHCTLNHCALQAILLSASVECPDDNHQWTLVDLIYWYLREFSMRSSKLQLSNQMLYWQIELDIWTSLIVPSEKMTLLDIFRNKRGDKIIADIFISRHIVLLFYVASTDSILNRRMDFSKAAYQSSSQWNLTQVMTVVTMNDMTLIKHRWW